MAGKLAPAMTVAISKKHFYLFFEVASACVLFAEVCRIAP